MSRAVKLPKFSRHSSPPFTPTARADIEFIRELGDPTKDLDSHVWMVKINGATPYYALKMVFQFYLPPYLRSSTGRYFTQSLSSPLLYLEYLDPFHCECRAYGRLKQEGREDLAVTQRARGIEYPPVGPEDVLNGRNSWGRWEIHRGLPVRAIVKELVANDGDAAAGKPFAPSRLRDLWKDLEDLHRLGILVRDINPGNYIGGKLIDFSQSWTVPSPCFDSIHPEWLLKQRRADSLRLHESIVDFGVANRWDWVDPGYDGPTELDAYYADLGDDDADGIYGVDPTGYDWRKWDGDLEEVDAFLKHELYAAPEAEGPAIE
ncbi:kinetochore Sim4 complex subunit FTA2-domain-containing protein [Corynascus novoguineensis]|uniref:Kinetochore Sim4 complex subunit FTA2-domain-containing protein n=1 Tax=Corynascus novoguineensis TaxID=1126955 RepID=A0AAN7CJW5_9PEZI|nr:kinetochore Sim4 complex subunit FTA2-domain-containing protein [Corynascus novoguineensis]